MPVKKPAAPPLVPVWLTTEEAAAHIRVSETLAHWRWRGVGPAYMSRVHPGGKKPIIRYSKAALDAWLASGYWPPLAVPCK